MNKCYSVSKIFLSMTLAIDFRSSLTYNILECSSFCLPVSRNCPRNIYFRVPLRTITYDSQLSKVLHNFQIPRGLRDCRPYLTFGPNFSSPHEIPFIHCETPGTRITREVNLLVTNRCCSQCTTLQCKY